MDPEEVEIRQLCGLSLEMTSSSHAMRHCPCETCTRHRQMVQYIRIAMNSAQLEERERCAKICEDLTPNFFTDPMAALYSAAKSIRNGEITRGDDD